MWWLFQGFYWCSASSTWFPVQFCWPRGGRPQYGSHGNILRLLVFQDSGKSTSPLFSSHWSSPSLSRSFSDAVAPCYAPNSSSSLTSRTFLPTAHAASCLSFGRGSINSATCSSGFYSKSQWNRNSGRYWGKKNWFPVKLKDLLFRELATVTDCNLLAHVFQTPLWPIWAKKNGP